MPQSFPRSLLIWGDLLEHIKPGSAGHHDKEHAWKARYDLFRFIPKLDSAVWMRANRGHLHLEVTDHKLRKLDISSRVAHVNGTASVYTAQMTIANDATATPLEWTVHSDLKDKKNHLSGDERFRYRDLRGNEHQDVALPNYTFRLEEQGSAETLWKKHAMLKPSQLSSEFSIIDALQRSQSMANELPSPFALVESFQSIRTEQRLTSIGEQRIETNGGELMLHGYRRIGPGTTPVDYWLTESHQVVIITGLYQGYIIRPNTQF